MREKLIDIVEDYADFLDWDTKEEMVDSIMEFLAKDNNVPSKWIPVTERLPDVRVPVLTYGRKGAIGIGFTQPTSVTADGKVHFYPRYGDNLPTHWMPLPEPPKGE